MSNDTFDVEGFIAGVQAEVPTDTFTPHPAGDFVGSIRDKSVEIKKVPFSNGDTGARFTAYWVTSAEQPAIRDEFLLDIVRWDDGSNMPVLATGQNKNVRLGKRLAALGLARPGWSFAQMNGAGPARIKVEHEPDKKDPEIVYARVAQVSAAR